MTVQCEFDHLSMSLAAHAYALRLLVCYDMRDAAIEPSEACENRRVRRVLAGVGRGSTCLEFCLGRLFKFTPRLFDRLAHASDS